jgi:hypothetical protein
MQTKTMAHKPYDTHAKYGAFGARKSSTNASVADNAITAFIGTMLLRMNINKVVVSVSFVILKILVCDYLAGHLDWVEYK